MSMSDMPAPCMVVRFLLRFARHARGARHRVDTLRVSEAFAERDALREGESLAVGDAFAERDALGEGESLGEGDAVRDHDAAREQVAGARACLRAHARGVA